MTEKTLRQGSKWARVSGSRGHWIVAQGYRDVIKAAHVYTMATKALAESYARGWIVDQ